MADAPQVNSTQKLKAPWFGPWTPKTADAAAALIRLAAGGDAEAQGQIDAIKAAADTGDPKAVEVASKFDVIATRYVPQSKRPSHVLALHAHRTAMQRQYASQTRAAQPSAQVEKLKRSLEQMRRGQERMRQQQERQRTQQMLAAQRRSAQANARAFQQRLAQDQMAQSYQARIQQLQVALQQRDLQDEMRGQLTQQLAEQAALYEQQLASIQDAAATAAAAAQVKPEIEAETVRPEEIAQPEEIIAEEGYVEVPAEPEAGPGDLAPMRPGFDDVDMS
jgi:hypothetical protein